MTRDQRLFILMKFLFVWFGIWHGSHQVTQYEGVLLHYNFGLEMLKGIPNKVELDAVNDFFRKYWEGHVHRERCWVSVVINETGREAVEWM